MVVSEIKTRPYNLTWIKGSWAPFSDSVTSSKSRFMVAHHIKSKEVSYVRRIFPWCTIRRSKLVKLGLGYKLEANERHNFAKRG